MLPKPKVPASEIGGTCLLLTQCGPRGKGNAGGEERVGRGEFWSLQLIKPGPQSSALIGSLLPEASGLLAMHLKVDECGNGV